MYIHVYLEYIERSQGEGRRAKGVEEVMLEIYGMWWRVPYFGLVWFVLFVVF